MEGAFPIIRMALAALSSPISKFRIERAEYLALETEDLTQKTERALAMEEAAALGGKSN